MEKCYVISGRPDAFGCRMLALLSAFWVARKINYHFYFSWLDKNDTLDQDFNENHIQYCSTMAKLKQVFNQTFIQKHHIPNHISYGINFNTDLTLEELKKYKEIKYNDVNIPYEIIKDISKEQCLLEIASLYKNDIGWSDRYLEILSDVNNLANQFPTFIAIHVRGGEHIFSKYNQVPEVWMNLHHFPYEIVLEIILNLEKNTNIILFGQDLEANELLVKYVKKNTFIKNIATIDSLITKKYTKEEKAFFDINFIAKASKIYSSGFSNFSRLAMLIAGKDSLVTYFQLFSTRQLYDIIFKNMTYISLNKLYTAYSFYRLYAFSRQLDFPIQKSIDFLQEALKNNPDNFGYIIALNECYFITENYQQINENIKYIVSSNRFQLFEEVFYGDYTEPWWTKEYYFKIYESYTNCLKLQQFPYIAYIAAKIHLNVYKDNIKAINILKLIVDYQQDIHINNFFMELIVNNYAILAKEQPPFYHLAYKLGNVMIKKSKSFFGLLTIIPTLIAIAITHKELNTLNNDSNSIILVEHQEILKQKICFTYKLGEALIKASKNWYKGGYIRFIFKDLPKLKNEYKKGVNKK